MRVFFCPCAYVASIQIKRYAQLVLVIERGDCFRNSNPEKSGSAGHYKVVQSCPAHASKQSWRISVKQPV
jgi:hypothetical protein